MKYNIYKEKSEEIINICIVKSTDRQKNKTDIDTYYTSINIDLFFSAIAGPETNLCPLSNDIRSILIAHPQTKPHYGNEMRQ
jgi:hypothetical protein